MTSGVVLALGPGRDSVVDVPLLRLGGVRLVDLAVRHLRAVCDDVVVAAGRRRVGGLPVEVVEVVAPTGSAAALAAAGLDVVAHELVMVLDAVHLTPDVVLLSHLASRWDGEAGVVPSTVEGPVPWHALWTRTAGPDLPGLPVRGGAPLTTPVLEGLGVRVLDALQTAALVSHDRWSRRAIMPPDTIDLDG